MKSFLSCFKNSKPIIGVIHTKGINDFDVMERAKREIALYAEGGIDGILVETYFGNYYQVQKELEYLQKENYGIPYGVNCLNVDAMTFELANQYGCQFLQLDSVVGHVKPRDEASLEAFLETFRSRSGAFVMGGVRFKYQPVLSECSLEEDLEKAKKRCDAICVTGDATGCETALSKIIQFREAIGDFPLIVCAGVRPDNIRQQLQYADGAVIASYFKDNYQDDGEVSAEHIKEIMDIVKDIRQKQEDGRGNGKGVFYR